MPGRHRQLHRTGVLLATAAVAVTAITGGAWAGYQQLSDEDCGTDVRLRVAAAPEIAAAVRSAAAAWTAREAGRCVTVAVSVAEPTALAAAIGAEHGVNLAGVGGTANPADYDIWMPDSSTWLLRIASEAPGFVPAVLGSVASSPIVLAVPSPSTDGRTPAMTALAQRIATDKSLRPGIVDPTRSAAGLGGLLVLAGAAGTDASAAALKVGVMRALAANSASIRDGLLSELPQSTEDIGTSVGLAPLSEADVIGYNGGRPPIPLTALYPQPASVVLDYPYAVLPGVDPQKATAAAALHAALDTPAYRADLARTGVRGPDGVPGPGFAAPATAPPAVPPPPAPKDPKVVAGAITQLLGSWAAITQPGRMLAVFDVSGSMTAKVPTAGGLTRAEVTQRTAKQGLALLDDRWSVGNWTFSTDMAGSRPWVENVPISSVATHRAQLSAAITRIVPKSGGDTGLFDTALAAYRQVQKGWQAGVSNSVVIYTDGRNDNPGGLTIDQLVDRMTRLRDPDRPVRMIIIGMGTAIDRAELEAITKAAGSGGVYIATDPAKIGEIFLEAIASRKGA